MGHRLLSKPILRPVTFLRVIPLQTDQHVFRVICIHIQHPMSWFADVAHSEKDQPLLISWIAFYWTYLEQVTSLIERYCVQQLRWLLQLTLLAASLFNARPSSLLFPLTLLYVAFDRFGRDIAHCTHIIRRGPEMLLSTHLFEVGEPFA
jgi:hypothetical protein